MVVDTGEIPVVRMQEPSFEAYYRAQRQHIFRALALTLGNRDLAEDAVDEAMTRTYQHWRTVSSFDNQAGWTYRVGLNWARSRLRKRKREILSTSSRRKAPRSPLPIPISIGRSRPYPSTRGRWWFFAITSTGAPKKRPEPWGFDRGRSRVAFIGQ